MVLSTKEASYIIVLGIVISVLPISSTHLSLSILILEHLQDLAVCLHGIADHGLLKSIVVISATNA